MTREEEIADILAHFNPELASVAAGHEAIFETARQIMDLYKEEQMALELFGDIMKGMGVNFGRQETVLSAPVQDIVINLQDGDYNGDGYIGESPSMPEGDFESQFPMMGKDSCGCEYCTCQDDFENDVCGENGGEHCICGVGEEDATENHCDN